MLWYTDDSIAARGPSPQLHGDCQSWCEATAESDCNVRASALTQAGLKTVFDSAIKKVLAPTKPPRPAKVGPFRRLLRQVMIRA